MTVTVDLSPEPGWRELERRRLRENRSFVSGDPEGDRLRVRYFEGRDGHLVAKCWFGPWAEGPPGHAHGGSIAAVLDEAMGANCWHQGRKVLAGTLTIKYLRPLPLGTVARVTTGLDRQEGRKLFAVGTVRDAEGTVYAEGEAVFVEMRPELAERLFEAAERHGRATPDAY